MNIPTPLPQAVETQFVGDLSGIHRVGEILFVCEDEKESVAEFVFVEHALKFFTSLGNTFAIVGIDDKDNALSVLEI